MEILYLDPFHGGSHAAVAGGLVRHSRHRIRLMSLPARSWKWRMRGAALAFAETLAALPAAERRADLILTTDMLSVADLLALLPVEFAACRIVVYFHENQLTYPDRQGHPRDEHFAFTNLTSALAADRCWFNSEYHRTVFLDALPGLLARMPDHPPRRAVSEIRARSSVLEPGIELTTRASAAEEVQATNTPVPSDVPPLILWNHRWEHDKAPTTFFTALERVQATGGRFRLAVAGQCYRQHPPVFDTLRERFPTELVSCGELPRDAYQRLLGETDIVVSTARHEFFGVAVLEAIAAGAYPLLPARLSYPEIIPTSLHADHLYADDAELVSRLLHLLEVRPTRRAPELCRHVRETYAWPKRVVAFDAALEALLRRPPDRPR